MIKQKNNKDDKKGKALTVTSSVSGVMGFLGGYQVCHNVCLGIIALLSIIGISLVGMPLLFLTKVAIPFWITAFFLFVISLFFYIKNKCISKNLLLFNVGIIIAGVPFNSLKNFLVFFWIVGGTIVLISIVLFIRDKQEKRIERIKNR
ncbi:hypothetical protein J4221_02160 [Candidatus Pacearchaeota archaeon]|nr:hypothetical protein [Candidatus Pacearchaeota archaeon]